MFLLYWQPVSQVVLDELYPRETFNVPEMMKRDHAHDTALIIRITYEFRNVVNLQLQRSFDLNMCIETVAKAIEPVGPDYLKLASLWGKPPNDPTEWDCFVCGIAEALSAAATFDLNLKASTLTAQKKKEGKHIHFFFV